MPASSTDATGSAANDTANATAAQAVSTPVAGQAAVQRGGRRAHGQEHGEPGRQHIGRRHRALSQMMSHHLLFQPRCRAIPAVLTDP